MKRIFDLFKKYYIVDLIAQFVIAKVSIDFFQSGMCFIGDDFMYGGTTGYAYCSPLLPAVVAFTILISIGLNIVIRLHIHHKFALRKFVLAIFSVIVTACLLAWLLMYTINSITNSL